MEGEGAERSKEITGLDGSMAGGCSIGALPGGYEDSMTASTSDKATTVSGGYDYDPKYLPFATSPRS